MKLIAQAEDTKHQKSITLRVIGLEIEAEEDQDDAPYYCLKCRKKHSPKPARKVAQPPKKQSSTVS